jgi:hypothetical protein
MDWVPQNQWQIGTQQEAARNVRPLSDAQKSVVTGTQLEDDFAAATIGKVIPLFIGGQALIGCKLAEGPYLSTVDDEAFVEYIITPCMFAVPGATREFTSLRLNGTESFTSADGGATWTELGSVFSGVGIAAKFGTETQLPFAASVTRYGARAVPYRSHGLIELKVVPLAPFANLIPFVSVYVEQDETLTRQDALERILRFVRFDDSEFEVNVSGQDTFWIKVGDENLFEFLQTFQAIFRNWNIVATDKLRIFENSSTVTPIDVGRDDVSIDSVRFWIDSPETVPAERTLGIVDTDGDNDFYTTPPARRQRYPIPLTSSQESQSFELPIGMGRLQARALVNISLLIDEFARDKCSFKLLPHMRGIEPGDILALDFGQTFPHWRVISIARNATDWTSDAICERIELSLLTTGPSITSDSTITVDEEDGVSVVTVTSDQEGTFSIIGGDDAALFTIDEETGVLEFLVEPDYEDPQDADNDNDYEVIVQVLADGLTGTQLITVTVADVIESGASGSPMGLLLALTNP